jgi:hypothetical protein
MCSNRNRFLTVAALISNAWRQRRVEAAGLTLGVRIGTESPQSVGFSRLPVCHQLELVETGNLKSTPAGFSRLAKDWLHPFAQYIRPGYADSQLVDRKLSTAWSAPMWMIDWRDDG